MMGLSESQVQDGEQDDLANTIGTILDQIHSETVDAEVRNSTRSDDNIGPIGWHWNDACGFRTDRNTLRPGLAAETPNDPSPTSVKCGSRLGTNLF